LALTVLALTLVNVGTDPSEYFASLLSTSGLAGAGGAAKAALTDSQQAGDSEFLQQKSNVAAASKAAKHMPGAGLQLGINTTIPARLSRAAGWSTVGVVAPDGVNYFALYLAGGRPIVSAKTIDKKSENQKQVPCAKR
jgi:hypothetical protein